MRYIFLILAVIFSLFVAQAQRSVNKSIPATGIEQLSLKAEYASITVKTWEQNTIDVVGTINVFDNTQNDAFQWKYDKVGSTINMESSLEGWKKEQNYWKEEADCCKKRQIDIKLVIKMPKNIALKMRSTYGSIEVENVETALDILNTYGSVDVIFSRLPKTELRLESTYSHVDISVPKSAKASFTLKTPYGEVLTDMPLEVKAGKRSSKSTLVAHLNGGGTAVYAEAGYNTIYLRELE
ncbi:MAG: DUF4097 family beta strand repeat-containing protein [Bacteroidota bacterium]